MVDQVNDTIADARDGTIDLVSAYISNSNTRLSSEELQALIRDTFATLLSLTAGPTAEPAQDAQNSTPKSKAEIKKSIGADALISFEDGKPYQSLKRHLTTRGMSPAEYRAKHGLAADYPMVHPAYSARRSEMAKAIGLGQKGRQSRHSKSKPKTSRPPKGLSQV